MIQCASISSQLFCLSGKGHSSIFPETNKNIDYYNIYSCDADVLFSSDLVSLIFSEVLNIQEANIIIVVCFTFW